MLNFNYNVIYIFVILENRKVKNYKKLKKKKNPAEFEFITNGFLINVLNHHDTLLDNTFKREKIKIIFAFIVYFVK